MADELIKYFTTESAEITSAMPNPQRDRRAILFSKNAFIAIGLKHLLEGAGFAVSGIATDDTSLSLLCSDASSRLTIIDGNNPVEQVAGTIRSLKGQYPHLRVFVIADTFDLKSVQMGLQAGADGFCTSDSDRDVLIKSIELVALGETILPTELVRAFVTAGPQPQSQPQERMTLDELPALQPVDLRTHRLSAREVEILTRLTKGDSNKLIARRLDVAEATVKVHIKAILRKIGAANRTQAAMWATEHMPKRGEVPVCA